jgi:Regulator of ribonuclease activity B
MGSGEHRHGKSITPAIYEISKTNVSKSEGESDEAVLSELRAKGSDLTKVTDVAFYLYVPARRDAEAAATTLREHGYQVEVREPLGEVSDDSHESRYSIVARIGEIPSLENLRANRVLCETLAGRYEGEYDGWEAAIA